MAKSKMGEEEAYLTKKQKKKIQVKRCDIDNGDGTMDHIEQDIDDLLVSGTRLGGEETEDLKRAARKMTMDDHQQDINDPRVLGTRLGGTMKMTMDDHQQDINDPRVLGTRLGGTMKMTMDDHQQDINDPRVLGTRLGGTMKMTRDDNQQDINDPRVMGTRLGGTKLLKVTKEIQGEDERDKMYKDEGAGLNGMVKGGGVGLDETVKGEGAGRGQGTRDINASYSYPLVNHRLEEAHDDGAVVQSTGADRSPVQPLDIMVNPSYSQYLKDNRIKDNRNKNGDRNREDDKNKDDRNKEGNRIKSDRNKDVRHIKEEDEEYKDEDGGAGRGKVHKDGGAGLVDMVKGEGAGRSKEVKRIKGGVKRATRWVKVNMGGEELNLYHNTGNSITIITPAMYRQNMGKVVAAKRYLRARGSLGYLDTKGMVKTTLTTASGASTWTWVCVVASGRPQR